MSDKKVVKKNKVTKPKKNGRPRTKKITEENVNKYFDKARVPNVAGLCLHLDITMQYFYLVMSEPNDVNKDLLDIFTRARMRIENRVVEGAMLGDYNAQVSNKILSSKFGYVEKSQQEITHKEVPTIKIVNDIE